MVVVARGDIDSVAWSPWRRHSESAGSVPGGAGPRGGRWSRGVLDSLHGAWQPFWSHGLPPDEVTTEDFADIEISDSEDDESDDHYWISDLHLTLSDKRELLDGSMLSDKHIMAAQRLLAESFPHLSGFQDTCLSQISAFRPVTSQGVQIHHTRGGHWVVTSWRQGDVVQLYDSLYDDISPDLVEQIESVYVSARRDCRTGDVLVRQVPIAKQRGYRDCGLFAIAIALELCQDYDVREVRFKQNAMRKHLLRCFRNRHLESFPQS